MDPVVAHGIRRRVGGDTFAKDTIISFKATVLAPPHMHHRMSLGLPDDPRGSYARYGNS
jgi:hypothetical protein